MKISRIMSRIVKSLPEACGHSPLPKWISGEEINGILEQEGRF